uniref:AlNc14C242G9478 protein n=1 Tax=Albugo laibachii Nc14 TaxID=890382 RepID=F0WSY8_9STRA|nr:AlNc14C242G9478 [Albugo laibachii Nc14]|eukprot:CCA24473.1 AlNc14C242G9478 [Albugo laibachii Nc14]
MASNSEKLAFNSQIPDFARFAVHKITRRTHAPTTADWELGNQRGEGPQEYKDLKICLGGEVLTLPQEITLKAFSDADYATDVEMRTRISVLALLFEWNAD